MQGSKNSEQEGDIPLNAGWNSGSNAATVKEDEPKSEDP